MLIKIHNCYNLGETGSLPSIGNKINLKNV